MTQLELNEITARQIEMRMIGYAFDRGIVIGEGNLGDVIDGTIRSMFPGLDDDQARVLRMAVRVDLANKENAERLRVAAEGREGARTTDTLRKETGLLKREPIRRGGDRIRRGSRRQQIEAKLTGLGIEKDKVEAVADDAYGNDVRAAKRIVS